MDEIEVISQHLDAYLQDAVKGVVFEADGLTPRAVHGLHLYDDFFKRLTEHNEIVNIAASILREDVYGHQFKINLKKGKVRASWPWHQDYIFWKEMDNIQAPNLINIAVFLDDINEESGPLCLIPESHTKGNLSEPVAREPEFFNGWANDVSEDLKYQVPRSVISQLLNKTKQCKMTGKAGDVLLFDPQIVHSSSDNLSTSDRRLIIITHNQRSNIGCPPSERPEFLCSLMY